MGADVMSRAPAEASEDEAAFLQRFHGIDEVLISLSIVSLSFHHPLSCAVHSARRQCDWCCSRLYPTDVCFRISIKTTVSIPESTQFVRTEVDLQRKDVAKLQNAARAARYELFIDAE